MTFHILLLSWQLASALEVLDVGASRTGTQSLRAALDLLGYKTLHSGYDPGSREASCEYLFGNGTVEAAMKSLDGYDAAMDEPFHLLYREVMATFPESKFVYPAVDPEMWFASYDKLISEINTFFRSTNKMLRGLKRGLHVDLGPFDPDHLKNFGRSTLDKACDKCHSWGCRFGHSDAQDSKQQCIQSYRKHLQNLTQAIPKDRLLIFNMSDGWAPLCNFLGKSIPKQPFPHVDIFQSSFDILEKASSFVQKSAQWKPYEL
ncbi:unnamed protein product [Durusdinium trenchii]|uniref:Uncharacterized protein n=1 Tax=Durusdinium trenchii TaxID=1381693 RepID=A0ABP0L2L8_9DINO